MFAFDPDRENCPHLNAIEGLPLSWTVPRCLVPEALQNLNE